ncbi:MAG: hypothetical protein JXR10_10475 [Cyclobacteriaceae bacterium]
MLNVRGKLFTLIVLLTMLDLSAQKITLKGGFVEDSLKIGENINFWMSAKYPESFELILPDTTYDFTPFEFSRKEYFEGKIINGEIFDSAVYTLQSYEIDPVQYLTLPAFLIKENGDSTRITMDTDSIYFYELIPQVTDTTSLKTNIAYLDVSSQFNYPMMWIILGVLLILAIGGYLIFGSKVRKYFKLRSLRKAYISFSEQLTLNIRALKSSPDQELAEKTLSNWKMFLEKLEERPFSKLTTKEIMNLGFTSELNGTLKSIDRSVYGAKVNEELYKDFQAVEDFTQHRYSIVIDQIKNEK